MSDFFARMAESIIAEAVDRFKPTRIYAGLSGGNDSLALAHWMMSNVPGTELFHINTGIGVKQAEPFVRETCEKYNWPLTVIRSKEDCGQDYDAIVRKHGFPGPYSHKFMYRLLKERGVRKLVREAKATRNEKILLAAGIREDESLIRMGYKDMEINRSGAQVWANPIYWWSKAERDQYLMVNQIRRNPVSDTIGISGECLCGAFAQPGELDRVRSVDPDAAARIDRLHQEIKDRFPWTWEQGPPREEKPSGRIGFLCIGCEKSSIVQGELLT
jgi:3'-phosphoadenosine 5'-phosphosulfate sulfotransferase (PAPS reductase)/FAD synthetase